MLRLSDDFDNENERVLTIVEIDFYKLIKHYLDFGSVFNESISITIII